MEEILPDAALCAEMEKRLSWPGGVVPCNVVGCGKSYRYQIDQDRFCEDCWDLLIVKGESLHLPDGTIRRSKIEVRKEPND